MSRTQIRTKEATVKATLPHAQSIKQVQSTLCQRVVETGKTQGTGPLGGEKKVLKKGNERVGRAVVYDEAAEPVSISSGPGDLA